MEEIVKIGNIIRNKFPEKINENVNLYLGSGSFGASFGPYGLMDTKFTPRAWDSTPNTLLMHSDFWHKGVYGLDYLLPLGRLYFKNLPEEELKDYKQELDIFDGKLNTGLVYENLEIQVSVSFNPENLDIMAAEISYKAKENVKIPEIEFSIIKDIYTAYEQHIESKISNSEIIKVADQNTWEGVVNAGTANNIVLIKSMSHDGIIEMNKTTDGVKLTFKNATGRHFIFLGSAEIKESKTLKKTMKELYEPLVYWEKAKESWNMRWGNSYICIPDSYCQKMWLRSVYYILSSFPAKVQCPVSPMGFTGNGWPFHFPQDMAYIFPVLLKLGHFDIAKSIVEYYFSCLENMRDFTMRIYKTKGVMWAWEFPMNNQSKLLSDEYPNWYQFEIHNAAYPAFMAYETYLYTKDKKWAKKHAWQIVLESANFYAGVLKPGDDGKWGMHIFPSMGQDEWGGHNAKNYLCSLFSAQYCLQTAVDMSDSLSLIPLEIIKWKKILKDGLSFNKLYNPEVELYMTSEDSDKKFVMGKQKHPVQLGAITFLPVRKPDFADVNAFRKRNELCGGANENFYTGWTLATHWLAASRLGEKNELLSELEKAVPSKYIDENWTVIYETSGDRSMPMYLTNHGLYAQTIIDALICDYFGEISIGKGCPDEWKDSEFCNINLSDGKAYSMKINKQKLNKNGGYYTYDAGLV